MPESSLALFCDEHSTFGWIMEGLIARAGFRLQSAEYDNEVYGEYIAEAC